MPELSASFSPLLCKGFYLPKSNSCGVILNSPTPEARLYFSGKKIDANRQVHIFPPVLAVNASSNSERVWHIRDRFDSLLEKRPSGDPNDWDGTHNDDTNIIFYKNKWFLYYKGKPPVKGTRNGVATADNLLGPYVKYAGNPVFAGHAETAWVHRDGVAAFGYKTFWSEDGFHFVTASDWSPGTVGLYCPENFGNGTNYNGVSWGLKVMFPKGSARHIGRLEIPLLIEK